MQYFILGRPEHKRGNVSPAGVLDRMKPEALRISDWMRFWAPEVKKRIDRGDAMFSECRDAYEAVRRSPDDDAVLNSCLDKIAACQAELDKAPPGAYDHLAHIGTFVR